MKVLPPEKIKELPSQAEHVEDLPLKAQEELPSEEEGWEFDASEVIQESYSQFGAGARYKVM